MPTVKLYLTNDSKQSLSSMRSQTGVWEREKADLATIYESDTVPNGSTRDWLAGGDGDDQLFGSAGSDGLFGYNRISYLIG